MLRIFAFFSLDFFSGDRASDLRRIKTVDVSRHPDGSSLLFHQRVGKTLRGKTSRAFALKQTANPAICPCEISSSSSSFAIQCDLTFPLVFSSVQLPKQVVSLMPPSSPLPFKPDWSSTFHLSASMMVKLCTVLDPEPPSFLDFSECLERLHCCQAHWLEVYGVG